MMLIRRLKRGVRRTPLAVLAAACAGAAAWGAMPQVTDVVLKQISESRVKITYALSDEAIVTLRVCTNGVPLPAERLWNASGDVNRRVAAGARTIEWNVRTAWPSNVTDAARAEVTAWHPETPPMWCGIDLSSGSDATAYPVSYYATEADIPFGPTNVMWKTTHLLLRKCGPTDGGGFGMGSVSGSPGECWHYDATEKPTTVWLTKPYWIGVYEVTQAQWTRVKGSNPSPSRYKADPHSDGGAWRPVCNISRYDVRGSAEWPADRSVAADSFAGLLRARTGLAFDLPTEAQWEYACRAGLDLTPFPIKTTYLNEGVELTNLLVSVGILRYNKNQQEGGFDGTCDVGRYPPNPWGLYDMVGNVWELCLDRFVSDRTTLSNQIDPEGPATAEEAGSANSTIRGGSFSETHDDSRGAAVRCAARYPLAGSEPVSFGNVGCRMVVTFE